MEICFFGILRLLKRPNKATELGIGINGLIFKCIHKKKHLVASDYQEILDDLNDQALIA